MQINNNKQKCKICNKKINLGMDFPCRCGGIYCNLHRDASSHSCIYNYKDKPILIISPDKNIFGNSGGYKI